MQRATREPTAMELVIDPGPTRVGHFMRNLAPASTGAFFYRPQWVSVPGSGCRASPLTIRAAVVSANFSDFEPRRCS